MEGNLENNQEFNNLKGKVVTIPTVDNTLSKEGYAADAKATGNKIKTLESYLKKAGNYTGTGSSKTIVANQYGSLAMISCSTHVSFVTPEGAQVNNLANGEVSWADTSEVIYKDGILIIKTDNEAFNAAGTKYYYQTI